MSIIACPHCGAENAQVDSFCEQCGKALPGAAPSVPRVVMEQQVAATAVGQDLQADQLRKQCGRAAGALTAVAVLHVLGAILLYMLVVRANPEAARVVVAVNLALAVIYAILAFWARSTPLPAAIVGLVLFISVWVVSAILDPTAILQGIIVKIIVIVVLVRAIQAGLKHKQLRAARAAGL